MEVTPLKVPTRKLHCGSLRALLTGKAASTHGSTSKGYKLQVYNEFSLFWSVVGTLWVFGILVLMLSLVILCLFKLVHSLIYQIWTYFWFYLLFINVCVWAVDVVALKLYHYYLLLAHSFMRQLLRRVERYYTKLRTFTVIWSVW
jgi:hypothetical protein